MKHLLKILIVVCMGVAGCVSENADKQQIETVKVIGSVRSPGEYPFTAGMTVDDAINMAGGKGRNVQSPWFVWIFRGGEKTTIRLREAKNVKLEASDKIELPLCVY